MPSVLRRRAVVELRAGYNERSARAPLLSQLHGKTSQRSRGARDEIRHTRATRALARRYGGRYLPPVVRERPLRDVESVATDNAIEGCVRETFGALLGTWQARTATDPVIRAAMTRIARDETRHAALSHRIDGWVRRKLARAARDRVDQARRDATTALLAARDGLNAESRAALGLPSDATARLLAANLMAALSA